MLKYASLVGLVSIHIWICWFVYATRNDQARIWAALAGSFSGSGVFFSFGMMLNSLGVATEPQGSEIAIIGLCMLAVLPVALLVKQSIWDA